MVPTDLREQLRIVGQATGLDDEAARRIKEVDRAFADFTPAWMPKSMVVFDCFEAGKVIVYGANDSRR